MNKLFLCVFSSFFFIFCNLVSEEIISDNDYYNKGIALYKDASFDKAFIVFYNLAEKGDRDSQFNISNMYESGVGTTQNFSEALKWTWLCALAGEKKCFKKIDKLIFSIDKKSLEKIEKQIEDFLERMMYKKKDLKYALMLGFWFEKYSPEQNLEKSYLWYSVSVTGGLYRAMKKRNQVGDLIEPETLIDLQNKASKIYSDVKFFGQAKGDLK